MAGLRVHFVFPAEMVERVDAALTVGQSRGEFVRAAVEQALGEQATSVENPAREGVPGASGVADPAPAEQPEPPPRRNGTSSQDHDPTRTLPSPAENFERRYGGRSSVQAKRDVRPVPKAKP